MNISIHTLDNTVVFAAEELKKYLKMMFPSFHSEISFNSGKGFKLGTFSDLAIDSPLDGDAFADDIIYIDTQTDSGVISGNNPRSVLLAVYEYLKNQGCRFLFPGVDGEYIPEKDKLCDVKISHKASFKFRGQCIEGAISHQNVLDAIDYAPKAGLNSFMLECYSPYRYYEKWYNHRDNKSDLSGTITEDTAMQWKRHCESEIDKRGLLYNDMGHGFTTLAFGMGEFDTSDFKDYEYLASLGGKREFFHNDPIETNFCMSNDEARGKFVNFIADYAFAHSNVDMLHIWLADGMNNHCECDACSEMTPSDWYVQILNEVDAELTRRNLPTKLVFVVYCDLLWAPETERFNNMDRFVLLFAPISRDYNLSYAIDSDISGLTPYIRNKLDNPRSMASNLAYLDKWQENYTGGSFAYEYHFYFMPYFDIGGMSLAKCIYDDVQGLEAHNITGIMEDQSQRNSFPNNLPIYIWGRTMWDKNTDYESAVHDYFVHAYGEKWEIAYNYLSGFSSCLDFKYMVSSFKDRGNLKNDIIYDRLYKLSELTSVIKPLCQSMMNVGKRCQSVSWKHLLFLCDMCDYYIPFMQKVTQDDIDGALSMLNTMMDFIFANEYKVQNYFDAFLFGLRMKSALASREKKFDLN